MPIDTEDLTGAVHHLGQYGRPTLPIQVHVETGVTSVVIEGRADSTCAWLTLKTFNAAGTDTVATMPEMRAVITNANGLIKIVAVIL